MPTISMFFGIIIRMFFRDNRQHHLPHIHADCAAAIRHLALHIAAKGPQMKGLCFDMPLIPQKTGENPEAVAAFFSFAAVRIEYFQPHETAIGFKRPPQDAIGPDAEISMANPSYFIRRDGREILRRKDNVIVAEAVILVKVHFTRFPLPTLAPRGPA